MTVFVRLATERDFDAIVELSRQNCEETKQGDLGHVGDDSRDRAPDKFVPAKEHAHALNRDDQRLTRAADQCETSDDLEACAKGALDVREVKNAREDHAYSEHVAPDGHLERLG